MRPDGRYTSESPLMNPRYLLDTDWAINDLHGDAQTAAQVSELQPRGIGLSVISQNSTRRLLLQRSPGKGAGTRPFASHADAPRH